MSIEAITSAVPSIEHSAEDLAAQTGAEEAFIRDKVGVERRFVLGPDETGVGLAEAAARKLFETTDLEPGDVGLMVYVTQNPDRRIPHNAGDLADRLGLAKSLASFDLSLGCSGFVYALSVAEAFMIAQGIENALVVTCDPYSRIMAAEDKSTNAVFGDAAAATWLKRDGRTVSKGFVFGTDGAGGDAIRVDAGGAAKPLVSVSDSGGVAPFERDALRLHMNGRDVFNFVNAVVPKTFKQSLEKADLTMDEIDWFALHQGSAYMLKALAKRAGIPMPKLRMNIAGYGNTVSSTVPMLLEDLMAQEDNMAGQRVMISGFGVGLSWATGILEFRR